MDSLHKEHIATIDQPADYFLSDDSLRILVPGGVYHPHGWSSTRLMLSAIPDVRGMDVLEIGGGSGAVALAVKKRGAKRVVVTDISDRACAAMECNALLNGLDIDVRQGDLFTPVRTEERFDLVLFNLPLMDKPIDHLAEVALCDPAGEILQRFLEGFPSWVRKGGSALFTHASISAPLPIFGQSRIAAEDVRSNGEVLRVMWYGVARTADCVS